jgi:phosphonate metabolism protein PhnN/1,5-bisphosphokinase (PRPP-forming)
MTGAGRLVAVVGPSGAGKDTLIDAARVRLPGLHVVRRVITRPEAAGGEAFEGVTSAEFRRRKAAGAFAIDWRAHGLFYGIPTTIEAPLAAGRTVLFNGSRAALPAARARFPALEVVAVTAPDAVLAHRLAGRGRETAEEIAARLSRAAYALPAGARVVVNDGSVNEGLARFLAALSPQEARA